MFKLACFDCLLLFSNFWMNIPSASLSEQTMSDLSNCSRSVAHWEIMPSFSWAKTPWSAKPFADIWRTTQHWRSIDLFLLLGNFSNVMMKIRYDLLVKLGSRNGRTLQVKGLGITNAKLLSEWAVLLTITYCVSLFLIEVWFCFRLLPHIRGNVGFVFTKNDLVDVRDRLTENRVRAPARAGALAPMPVDIEPQNTGLGPEKTSFFQALSIPTKISKGTIEIIVSGSLNS